MYLLFVDESGTHGASYSFVLGAIAIHEQDAWHLARALDQIVEDRLSPSSLPSEEMELHATELRNAKTPSSKAGGRRFASPWVAVQRTIRLDILRAAYRQIADFRPRDYGQPAILFGVVLDSRFHQAWTVVERERFAYEVLLNKFDTMLKRTRATMGLDNRGLVIHDRRVVAERDIQEWTREWRKAAGTIGQLRNLVDVPLFADSKAMRLLQAADLVSYALYRHYDPNRMGEDYMDRLWDRFDTVERALHGCVHYTPGYGAGTCDCRPCKNRLLAETSTTG